MSDPNREPTSQPIFNFENDTNYQDMAAVLDEAVFNLLGTPYYSPGAESSSQETIERLVYHMTLSESSTPDNQLTVSGSLFLGYNCAKKGPVRT
jgi:hypothetical protein